MAKQELDSASQVETINNSAININGLVPDFKSLPELFTAPLTSPELSAFFVTFLITVAVYFFLSSLVSFGHAIKRIKWLNSLIKGQTSETIFENRHVLLEKAQKVKHEGGHLWMEFDETLIEAERINVMHLHNTFDANYFFNASSLAGGITESRMLAAVPGFLTALGVIGTFVGLQLGLSELKIGNDIPIEQMKDGLSHVISGASIAFMTSVWGVSLSVVFNFSEKALEKVIRTKIYRLQNKIDNIFPRLSAEHQLQRIANNSHESQESLKGLAEKIGQKMQESLMEVTAGIQSSLESSLQKIMGPAINKLVDETNDGNQQALEQLIDKFMDSFGEQGKADRKATDEASDKMAAVLNDLNSGLAIFLNELKQNQSDSIDREKDLVREIADNVTKLSDDMSEQRVILTNAFKSQLDELSKTNNERQNESDRREEELGLSFTKQTESMKNGIQELLENIEKGFDKQIELTSNLLDQGQELQEGINIANKANLVSADKMKTAASDLRISSDNINTFGSQIKQAGDNLSTSVTEAVNATKGIALSNLEHINQINVLREQLGSDTKSLNDVISSLQTVINTADTTFDNMTAHQNKYLGELKLNVQQLATQMTELLNDYAEQANSQTENHLNLWSKHTTNFDGQMTATTRALSATIDQINAKLGEPDA